ESADRLPQNCRHRRPRTLPRARLAQRDLQSVGARVRIGGFQTGASDPWQDCESDRGRRAEPEGGGAVLPGELLVLADPASGEVPPAPPRPQGIERNVVITQWDWSDAKGFIHDVMTTDSRNPTLNANGLIYGPEQFSADMIDVLDPVRHTTARFPAPMRDVTM